MAENSISTRTFLLNYLKIFLLVAAIAAVLLVGFYIIAPTLYAEFEENVGWTTLFTFVAVGFAAQMIDGSLGMAYGISCSSFLMATGVTPVLASASVHVAEVFTTASSGFFHWKLGNFDKKLFRRIAIPGVLGAAAGAFLLSNFDGKLIQPYISAYLILMGFVLIQKSFRPVRIWKFKRPAILAAFGGFMDASGGGGWGPIVSTTLMAGGNHPAKTIGTVNATEFFVAFAAGGVFSVFVGIESIEIVAGLVLGGMLAAPMGALLANKINKRYAMIMVGLLIIFLSGRTVLKSIGLL
ncbi:MAG: sulfite exporter TauE/SafE family protein [Bacteroidetes bacterium]|nr:sulfite exporter TauE/SafE family protein [Bacteroidota bacterium]